LAASDLTGLGWRFSVRATGRSVCACSTGAGLSVAARVLAGLADARTGVVKASAESSAARLVGAGGKGMGG